MSGEEPYRWLEAIANRREYVRDQLRGATPVFAVSRPEGVLLLGAGTGRSKVFEIYDRLGFAALGHPVDIEKVRQSLIETAHQEGFLRAPEDVTLRRLLNFSLGPALKTSFEQIFSAPLMVECVLAEVGGTPADDVMARVAFDGAYRFSSNGVTVVHTRADDERAAADWLGRQLKPEQPLGEVVRLVVATWRSLTAGSSFAPPDAAACAAPPVIAGRTLEGALLDRRTAGRARYRGLTPSDLS